MTEGLNMGRDKDNMYKWRKQNQKRFEFYINRESDPEVLEWFELQPNKRQYLIDLIRKDMNEKKPVDEEN